jgi:hypothetical protein
MANEINIGINTTSDLSGLNQVDESVKSLRTQIKEATANVVILSEKFGATSKEAVQAAKAAAILKDRMGDAKSLTDAFNPDAKFKAVSASLTGVAGGFSALQGAIGLFGEESKDVEKAILKVQSAMALASGIQAIGESIDSFKQMKAVAVNAFNAIKGAIGATGIGLLVVALGTIYAYWDDIKEAVSGVSEEQKKLNADSKKNLQLEQEKLKQIDAQENILKLQGKSERYILNLKIEQGQKNLLIAKDAVTNQINTNKQANIAVQRNYVLLKSFMDFISLPQRALYETAATAINNIIKLINKLPGVKIDFQLDEKLGDKASEYISKLAFDPEKTKKEGEETIKALEATAVEIENKIAGNKLAIKEIDKKASDESAQKRKEKQKEEDEKAKERAKKSSELLAQQLKEQEELLANSEVKKENLINKRAKKEIEDTVLKKDQILALANEEANHVRLLEEAKIKDQEAAYAKEIEIQNSRDIGFEEDLQKQLEHYEEIFAIQVKFGKNTKETQIQIDKTKEALRKENYNKELESLTAQYTNLENDLVKQEEFNKKKLELQKIYGEKTLETENAIVDGKAKLGKKEIDNRAATIDAVGKMVVAGAEIGNFIADSLKANAGKDKQRQKTAIRVGAASSIAGVIGSTASANAGFLANPASISTMGLAAAVPIATNITSSLVAIANIIQQKNKAIAEIDNASDSSGGGDVAKPTSKFATGGLVTGMGTSTSDSIMANLSNGESVINAKSTAMFGNLLSNINQAGGGVAFGNQNNANPIFKTYVVASEMTSQIEANLKLKQIARL